MATSVRDEVVKHKIYLSAVKEKKNVCSLVKTAVQTGCQGAIQTGTVCKHDSVIHSAGFCFLSLLLWTMNEHCDFGVGNVSHCISYAVVNTVQMSYIQLYVFTVTFGKCPKAM